MDALHPSRNTPLSVLDLYPKSSLCFENINRTGKTLGYLPLNTCNCEVLYDSDYHEFTPCWNQEDCNVSSINVSVCGVMKIKMVLGNGKQMCFLSMVLHGEFIKSLVNGGNLIQLTFFLEILQTSIRSPPASNKLTYCSKYVEI